MISRPLRFCMITTFYPPYHFGGDGVFVHRLANELAKLGHTVHVIHCLDAYQLLSRQQPSHNYPNHPNVKLHSLHSRFGRMSPLATQQTGRPLFKARQIQQILAQGFDVIHYHNISLVGGPEILTYGQAVKLYTMHEYWLSCPTHVLFRFNREFCRKRSCLACSVVYQRPPQLWRYTSLLAASMRQVDAFLAPSRFSKQIHEAMDLDVNIVHLPLFVSDDDGPGSLENQTSYEDKRPYFLFVGRLEKLKGVQTLIPLFRGYDKADLLIAGTGSNEAQLRALAAGCGNIHLVGFRSGKQLKSLYRGAVATIIPSLCAESFCLVAVESLQQGTPTIVRNLGGLPEIVAESEAGFIYETDGELRTAMDRLLHNSDLRRQMGERGMQAFRRNWTIAVHLERYFKLIEQIAETAPILSPKISSQKTAPH